MKEKVMVRKKIAVWTGVLIIAICAMMAFRMLIISEMQKQLSANLQDVANQNKITMEKELNSNQALMLEIAEQLEAEYTDLNSEEAIQEIVQFLTPFSEIYHFKRMGVMTTGGIAYCTDDYVCDLSYSETYSFGMQGLPNISGSVVDAIGEPEPINIFSVPLYGEDKKTVIGVLFADCRTESFKELLNVDSFEGLGYSYVINEDGTVVTDSKQSPMYGTTNIFETMMEFSEDNAEVISRLKAAMANGETGNDSFVSVSKRYLHYAPLEVDSLHQTWYLYTIVPAQVLDEKSAKVLQLNNLLVFTMTVVVAIGFLYLFWTYRKNAKELRTLAYVDSLTQGDNYLCFVEKLKACKGEHGYIVSADLNEFKLVNNTCGIPKGNETLQCVWNIIETNLKSNELAAHINADHYIMYLRSDSKEDIVERIRNISESVAEMAAKINIVSIWPYFGIYETDNLEDPEESYSKANQAKHLVKGNRKKNWAFYEEVDYEKMVEDKNIEDCFEDAIKKHEFEMWYQPKYSGVNEQIVGAEALVRWRREDGSLVPPFRFIPLFEKNGMITVLDEYVFRTVCMQQKAWEREGRKLYPISINISRASLYYDNVVEKYKEILDECEVKAELVPLEITESATIDNTQIQDLVDRFHAAGFPVYLDDFGNGYSSLAMLNLMHFDTLKLDKSLIDFVGDSNGEKLLWHTIKLAKSLGMHTTAEGVEKKEQVEFLQELQCDDIQGYYYSKPLPLTEFEVLLN